MNRNTTVELTPNGSKITHFFYLTPAEYDPSFASFVHLCKLCKSVYPYIIDSDPDDRNIKIEYFVADQKVDITLNAIYEQYVVMKKDQDHLFAELAESTKRILEDVDNA